MKDGMFEKYSIRALKRLRYHMKKKPSLKQSIGKKRLDDALKYKQAQYFVKQRLDMNARLDRTLKMLAAKRQLRNAVI